MRPAFGIVGKLAAVSLLLLAIPWLTLRYRQETHAFVLDGQRNALALAAQGVATVLHEREDLFSEPDGLLPFSPWEEPSCSPLSLEAPVRLDGSGRDWPRDADHTCVYRREGEGAAAPGAFALTLGQRDGYLYALIEVEDETVRLRHPRHRNLDGADHVRITVPGPGADTRRYLVTAEEPGPISAYRVGRSFRYAEGDGLPVPGVGGTLALSPTGWVVEMRLPIDMLVRKQVGFAVADLDAGESRALRVANALPADAEARIRLLLLDSPGTERILRGLDLPGAKISVVDERGRVRSEVGAVPDAADGPHRGRLIEGALAQGRVGAESGAATTAASAPIRAGARVVGAVLIEQANDRILALPREALLRERNAIVAACAAIAGVFWLFAWRLGWRIHRLRDEAAEAIDDDGRVRRVAVAASRRSRDEVGDLSRTVSGLLARLSRYTAFLERVPSTLRHEISNPLNTVSTSLENLVADHPWLAGDKYVKSASRGVDRINEIVLSLTEAASLEEALREDDPEDLDLAALVQGYVENVAAACPARRFTLVGADTPIRLAASGFRIEQLLDKLVDNAIAHSPEGGEIVVEIEVRDPEVRLAVGNDGPLVPEAVRERIFEPFSSVRASCEAGSGGPAHLGIGLYVARVITERMGGTLRVASRGDASGPVFEATLPLAPVP